MSDSATETKRMIEAIPGLTEEILETVRNEWHERNMMRQILNYKAAQLINQKRNSLEKCNADELGQIQGKIQGIRELIGLVNQQGES